MQLQKWIAVMGSMGLYETHCFSGLSSNMNTRAASAHPSCVPPGLLFNSIGHLQLLLKPAG